MGTRQKTAVFLCILLISTQGAPSYAQFSPSYTYYIELSRQAIERNDYQSLMFYVESAHLADPLADEPFDLMKQLPIYQNNIQVLKGYLLQAVQALDRKAYRSALFYFELSLLVTPDDALIREYIIYVKKLIAGVIVDEKPLVERIKKEYKITLPIKASVKKEATKKKEDKPIEKKERVVSGTRKEIKKPSPVRVFTPEPADTRLTYQRAIPQESVVKDVIVLDQRLWSLQPNTTIEIDFNKSVIIEGRNIERYLVLDQDYLIIERLDRDRIKLTSIRRGSTIFHLWDNTGRWTFNVRGVVPAATLKGSQKTKEDLWEEYVKPFRLTYSNNWGAFYRGNNFNNLSRRNLNFTQGITVYGETPYGFYDVGANFFKFEESTENTGRSMGLTDGKIGPFKDFTARGWDTYKRFSDLSLPGRYFRGGKIDGFAINRRIHYSYLRGQDRAVFETISEGVTRIRRSFIEGARLTLHPDTIHQYSINYGRGWGEERSPSLKDKVFSFDTEHQLGSLNLKAETAYDEDVYANIVNTKFEKENYTLRVNARHIDKDFVTLVSRPSGQGLSGGNIVYKWDAESGIDFSTNIELFKNHDIPNPSNPDGLNYELGTFFHVPLSDTVQWNISAFHSDTPQLLSPRRNSNLNTSLNKSFKLMHNKVLSVFAGANYQRSRFSQSPSSEYDRTTLRAGFRLPIFKRLSYFLNYDFSFVEVTETGANNRPSVISTGLSYSQTFRDKISTRASVSFRDEEDTDGQFSFLSGTDILRANLGISYRPTPDYEIFVDGSYRNVWAESNNQAAFNDADVRFGVRASWDLFFAWNPKGVISGFVYKDLNKNGQREAGEPGVADIRVRVGNKIAITNQNGFYSKEVHAKEVKVAIKLDTIPPGYSLTSDVSKRIRIEQGKREKLDFGFSVRTEVHGVVFHDINGNGSFDSYETTIPGAKIILDQSQTSTSDFEGIYVFYDVVPGEHQLKIDVNSIPLEYIPTVKLIKEFVIAEGNNLRFNVPLKKK